MLVQNSQLCALNLTEAKELILKENVIKHFLLPNLIRILPSSGLLRGVRRFESDVSGLSDPSSRVKLLILGRLDP